MTHLENLLPLDILPLLPPLLGLLHLVAAGLGLWILKTLITNIGQVKRYSTQFKTNSII
jgi:hypothetical protein